MTASGWIWKTVLALIGCGVGAYVGQELLGGQALGWTVGGAIVAGCCAPLFTSLIEWRKQKDAARLAAKNRLD